MDHLGHYWIELRVGEWKYTSENQRSTISTLSAERETAEGGQKDEEQRSLPDLKIQKGPLYKLHLDMKHQFHNVFSKIAVENELANDNFWVAKTVISTLICKIVYIHVLLKWLHDLPLNEI